MSDLDPNLIVGAVAASLVTSVWGWLRARAKSAALAKWSSLAAAAVDSLVDDALALGMTPDDARETFAEAAYVALGVIGVSRVDAKPLVGVAAEHGVQALRKRLGALALKRATVSLPELDLAVARALAAFKAAPVVEVRPEDVRMELVPFGTRSATTEPAPIGLPPLPPSGPSGRKG